MRAHVLGRLGLMAVQGQSGSDVLRPCWGHGPPVSPKLCRELSCVLLVGSVSGRRRPGFQVHRGKQISKAPPQGGPSPRTWLLAKAPLSELQIDSVLPSATGRPLSHPDPLPGPPRGPGALAPTGEASEESVPSLQSPANLGVR